MKAHAIIGKTVKAVYQERVKEAERPTIYHVDVIEFTDGTRLCLAGQDLSNVSVVTASVFKNGKRIG